MHLFICYIGSHGFLLKGALMNYMEYPEQGSIAQFMYRVYGYMAIGLSVTAVLAYYLSTIPGFTAYIMSHTWLLFGIFIFQIGLVIALSMFISRMNTGVAFFCFMLYAASLGVTLSTIFQVYTLGSIYVTFLVAAGMFGSMCLYGYFTRADLSTLGNICTMAVFGLIIGMLVNLFLKSAMMDYVLSAIGVVLFTLLTAYDTQKIKLMAQHMLGDKETMAKVAILGALTLYLDFINLFLFLLQFMGKKRD